jgi:hypothetical protein
MPEYLAPGVYVVEIPTAPKPIEGVSTSTERVVGVEVLSGVRRLIDRLPAGSETPDKDLAKALLELLAWVGDTLARQLDQLESEAWLPTAGLTAAALALTTKIRTPPDRGALKRIRYFEGQLLDPDDLGVTVDYPRSKLRQQFVPGIAYGFEVSVPAEGNGSTIKVSPGYAVDNRGRTIVLNEPLMLTSSLAAKRACVVMRPGRRHPPSMPLRALADWFLIVEEPERDDLLLACLERTSRGWQVEKSA